ncbi:MAG: MlaD family protein [Myxococcota bacterium]
MRERGIEVKVGILVTVCLALLVAFIVVLGDYSGGDRADLFLDVSTSAELKPGAPVKVAGVPAGKVKDVAYHGGRYDEDLGRRVYVRVHMRVDRDKLPTVHEDARFFITTQGLLGEKYVEIEPGTPESPSLEAGDIEQGEPPLRLELMAYNANRLLATLSDIIRDNEEAIGDLLVDSHATVKSLRRAAERVDGLLADNEENVDAALAELLELERQAQTFLASAQGAIGDGESLRRTIEHAEALSGDLRGQVGPIVGDVRETLASYRQVAETGDEAIVEVKDGVLALLGDARHATSDVATLTERIERGEGSLGALLQDTELYDDVREMLKDVKRHPWKFLWKE